MKKIFGLILSIFVITLVLMGCNAKSNPYEEKVKEFITLFYTVDKHEELDIQYIEWVYPENEHCKELKSIMESEAFDKIIINRWPLLLYHVASYGEFDIEVSNIVLKEYTTTEKGIVYNFESTLNFDFEEKVVENEVSGQLTVDEVNGEYKITQVNKIGINKDMLQYDREFIKNRADE